MSHMCLDLGSAARVRPHERSSPARRRGSCSRWRRVALAAGWRPPAAVAAARGERPGRRAALQVVAAENFWGSIAAQLGGREGDVASIIVNPATDPHSYEPTARDARTMAGAKMAIVNGLGYDDWARELLARELLLSARRCSTSASALGSRSGRQPAPVVLTRATFTGDRRDRRRLRQARSRGRLLLRAPAGRGLRDARSRPLRRAAAPDPRPLRRHPVGYSESIFQPLGEDLHLELLTPRSFAKAIAEGNDVTAPTSRPSTIRRASATSRSGSSTART